MNRPQSRAPQVCVLGSAEPGSAAYELAGAAGEFLAKHRITVVVASKRGFAALTK
jgi:hypothetical protein